MLHASFTLRRSNLNSPFTKRSEMFEANGERLSRKERKNDMESESIFAGRHKESVIICQVAELIFMKTESTIFFNLT